MNEETVKMSEIYSVIDFANSVSRGKENAPVVYDAALAVGAVVTVYPEYLDKVSGATTNLFAQYDMLLEEGMIKRINDEHSEFMRVLNEYAKRCYEYNTGMDMSIGGQLRSLRELVNDFSSKVGNLMTPNTLDTVQKLFAILSGKQLMDKPEADQPLVFAPSK